MTSSPYAQLMDLKDWADRDLCDVAARHLGELSGEEATIMLRILDHMHVVDRIFQHHLQGRPHGFQAPRSDALPDIGALTQGMRQVDDWYVSYVRSLAGGDLDQPVDLVFTSGRPARMTRGQIILHISEHGAYHRGNAGIILQMRGFAPGRDGITNYLEAAAA